MIPKATWQTSGMTIASFGLFRMDQPAPDGRGASSDPTRALSLGGSLKGWKVAVRI